MTNRWWVYQQERFPVALHMPMVIVFCLSALLFSVLQREAVLMPGFLQVGGAVVTTLILFFQLRVADEFKDFETDSRYRPHRAIPRGLVSLGELAAIAFVGAALQFLIAVYLDVGLVPILIGVWIYMALMTEEFFVPEWLRMNPIAYLLSHMLVMPIIAFYISAFAWLPVSNDVPPGLGWLLALSFFCGLVLEIGRKTKAPAKERDGVETYSSLWGSAKAAAVWVVCIAASVLAYLKALSYVATEQSYSIFAIVLPLIGLAAAVPLFRRNWSLRTSADIAIEPTSGLVALTLYLGLGPLQFYWGG